MPQVLSELKLNEISLVDRPANSTVDAKGKKTPRAVVALYKRDGDDEHHKHGPGCKCEKCKCMTKDISIVGKAAKGIQFVIGFKGDGSGSDVQSVLFDKDHWDENKARAWLKDHDFKAGSPDSTTNTLRFRQKDPGSYSRFRVIQPGAKQKDIAITEKNIEINKEITVNGGGGAADKHDYGPDDKELWKAIDGDPDATVGKDGTCQTQGGKCYPASDYAYVPDPSKPSTWKLRLTSTPGGPKDSGIVGAAAAALGAGFRGKKVQIPSAARAAVKSKVRAAWRAANPNKGSDEMPDALKKSEGENMTLEELEDRVTKQDTTIATLTKRNETLDAENALVIKMTKRERKLYASMDDDARKAFMAADTQKRGNMMEEAKRRKREKKLTDSMDDACKAEFNAAGPVQKAAMLDEQERLLAKKEKAEEEALQKRGKAKAHDTEDDQDDEDDEDDDDDEKEKAERAEKAQLRKQLAAAEDRIAKSESELDGIRKRERAAHFVAKAERELPNTPGSPVEKGEMLQKLADTFGEESSEFKKMLGNLKSADKVLEQQFSEIGKAAKGNIPTLAAFDAKVEEISKRDKIDKPHAVAKAMEEAPELYLDYEREQRQIIARA